MLNEVLRFSDLHTLSTLRFVNRRTKAVVKGFIPCNLIIIHAPQVLEVFTKTGMASHFTAVQVFDAPCSDSCAICGRFGAFLWVPDCIRCCIPCVQETPELMPILARDTKAAFGFSQKALEKVSIVHTLPGTYTLYQVPYRLLSRRRGREVAVEVRGGEEGLISYINSNMSRAKVAYDQQMSKWNAASLCFDSKGEINETTSVDSWFPLCLPYFNSELRSTQTGLLCKGCEAALERGSEQVLCSVQINALPQDMRDQIFTEDMFLDHFAICTDTQRLGPEHGTNGNI